MQAASVAQRDGAVPVLRSTVSLPDHGKTTIMTGKQRPLPPAIMDFPLAQNVELDFFRQLWEKSKDPFWLCECVGDDFVVVAASPAEGLVDANIAPGLSLRAYFGEGNEVDVLLSGYFECRDTVQTVCFDQHPSSMASSVSFIPCWCRWLMHGGGLPTSAVPDAGVEPRQCRLVRGQPRAAATGTLRQSDRARQPTVFFRARRNRGSSSAALLSSVAPADARHRPLNCSADAWRRLRLA